MAVNFLDVAIMALLVAAGCGVIYFRLQHAFAQALSELKRSNELQVQALARAIAVLESRAGEAKTITSPALAAAAETAKPKSADEIAPELIIVIAAAVTAFLGKKVRIRSAKRLQSPYEIVNPWSQQGRVSVQASHNLRSR